MNRRPNSTRDLRPSERRLVAAMQQIGFGRFESLRIEHGALADPWPTAVRSIKFGTDEEGATRERPGEFELKEQVVELIEFVRSVDAGEIRRLEVRHGLPFSMEIAQRPDLPGDHDA